MARPKPNKQLLDQIEVEADADKRLADILRKALNTPGSRHGNEPRREKPGKAK